MDRANLALPEVSYYEYTYKMEIENCGTNQKEGCFWFSLFDDNIKESQCILGKLPKLHENNVRKPYAC